jgi:hypothetical protein
LNNHFVAIIIFVFSFVSCGDSPFLNTQDSKKSATSTEINLNGKIDLSTENRSNQSQLQEGVFKLQALWGHGPSISDENKMMVILTDEGGNRFDFQGILDVYIWMPDMGHGSFPIKVTRLSEGIFELSEIFFTMDGYWDIHFEFIINDEVVEAIKWGLTL